jgi:activator of 2-hydroxyglutaryl-CoA dehydratase
MKKVSKQMRNMEVTEKPEMTLGLDMGDRYSHYCLLNQQGEVVEEGRMQSTSKPRCGGISRASLVCASRWNAARIRPGSAVCSPNWATR